MSDGITHSTVVYVVTEANNVYAIDGVTGAQIVYTGSSPGVNLGAPCTLLGSPLSQAASETAVIPIERGIRSTPVIDSSAGILYVVSCIPSFDPSTQLEVPQFNLNILSVSSLQPLQPAIHIQVPQPVAAASIPGCVTGEPTGVTTASNALNYQRSALTLFNGGVLIPFAGTGGDTYGSTGYLVYMNNFLTGASGQSGQAYFLTSDVNTQTQISTGELASIWMAGAGPATSGNYIYFATGNGVLAPLAPPCKPSYPASFPPPTSISRDATFGYLPDSLVELSGSGAGANVALGFVSPSFTPSNQITLDAGDYDLGSGGVLIVPAGAPGSITPTTPPASIVIQGKYPYLFVETLSPSLSSTQLQSITIPNSTSLINSDGTVGHNSNNPNQSYQNPFCLCAPSYYTGPDGGHVIHLSNLLLQSYSVSGNALGTTPSATATVQKVPPPPDTNPFGAFTSISSNGAAAGSAIVWTIPNGTTTTAPLKASGGTLVKLNLSAYDPANSFELLYSDQLQNGQGGAWPSGSTKTNDQYAGGSVLPYVTVANAHVYVGSDQQLDIWGVPYLVADTATMTSGPTTQGPYSWVGYGGPGTGYTQTVLTGGSLVVVNAGDFTSGSGFVGICGFQGDPSATWLYSMTIGGVTKAGAMAAYYYGTNGCANWSWSSAFGVTSGSTTSTVVAHLNAVTDKATMTSGPITQGSNSWVGYGPGTGYNPTVLSGGAVVVAAGDLTSGSPGGFISVCGFAADPTATWLTSMNINGVSKTGSSARYYYGTNGCAAWYWSSPFGVSSGTTVPTALMHLL
jgi:hypothetical protein